MRNILLIISNILKVTFKNKGNIVIYVFLPLSGLLLALLIYSGSDASTLSVGFSDNDNGALSAELRQALEAREGFVVSEVGEAEIDGKLTDFGLDAAVIVPAGFTESIYANEPADIEIVSLKGQDTTVWIEQLLSNCIDNLADIAAASGGDRPMFEKMLGQYKAQTIELSVVKLEDKSVGKSMTMTSIGFLIMFMMLGASFTSMIILKEKRNRTYYRICSAPVSSRQYILANSLTSLTITVIQTTMILLAMKYVFRIDTGVSDGLMFMILLLFGLVAIGLGLLLTAFSDSSYMATTLSSLVQTPTCMLGGCFWDVSFMPEFMQKISYFTPQRWAINAVEKLQAGAGITAIYLNLLVLAAFALAFTLVAVYKFSRTDNLQKFV